VKSIKLITNSSSAIDVKHANIFISRFLSLTMALLLSNVCVQFDVGPMKCFDMRMLLNSLLWLHLKTWKPMPVCRHMRWIVAI
jgi:hypothetical protein